MCIVTCYTHKAGEKPALLMHCRKREVITTALSHRLLAVSTPSAVLDTCPGCCQAGEEAVKRAPADPALLVSMRFSCAQTDSGTETEILSPACLRPRSPTPGNKRALSSTYPLVHPQRNSTKNKILTGLVQKGRGDLK